MFRRLFNHSWIRFKIIWLKFGVYGNICYICFMLRFIMLKKLLNVPFLKIRTFVGIQENIIFVQQYEVLK